MLYARTRSLFSLQRMNLLQPAPSPVGEGWGEGILRIAAIFPNTAISPIQALRLVALSLTLSHRREDGVAVGIKGAATLTHRVRALRHIPYRWVQRSSEKTLAAFVTSALR